jgi:hypothetical protein
MNSISRIGCSDWEIQRCARRKSIAPNETEPLLVRPRIAWRMLGCGNTRGYELLAAGELASFRDGKSRKIVVSSIRDYIARQLAAEPAKKHKDYTARATAMRIQRRRKILRGKAVG